MIEQLENSIRYNETIVQKSNEVLYIIEVLTEQRDKAKSQTMKNLLANEIAEYIKLINSFEKYVKSYATMVNNFCKSYKKDYNDFSTNMQKMKAIADNMDSACLEKKIYNMYILRDSTLFVSELDISNGFLISLHKEYEILLQIYLSTISRDFCDWKAAIKCFADMVAGWIPIFGEIKNCFDIAKELNRIMSEIECYGADCTKVDEKLQEIELHISVMEMALKVFTEASEKYQKMAEYYV